MSKNNEGKVSAYKAELLKYFGKTSGVVIEKPEDLEIEKFPTGSFKLDAALKGGYPKGMIIEMFGPEASGKTSTAIHAAAEHQKKYQGEPILWVDLERVFDPEYNKSIGLDSSEEAGFILIRPYSGEDVYEAVKKFCQMNVGGLVVIDSVALLLPSKEDQGDVGDAQMGSQARLNSQGLRKIFPHAGKSGTTLIFINQTRDKIGGYGDPTTTTGGKALGFYARVRLSHTRAQGEDGVSMTMNIKTKKATYGMEGAKVSTTVVYGEGIDRKSEIIDIALEHGIIEKAGSWFSYEGKSIGQGKQGVKAYFAENPKDFDVVEGKVKQAENVEV